MSKTTHTHTPPQKKKKKKKKKKTNLHVTITFSLKQRQTRASSGPITLLLITQVETAKIVHFEKAKVEPVLIVE